MSHTTTWKPSDGADPYGRPAGRGNYDEAWHEVKQTPCPKCGSRERHLTIEKDQAVVRCGPDEPVWARESHKGPCLLR